MRSNLSIVTRVQMADYLAKYKFNVTFRKTSSFPVITLTNQNLNLLAYFMPNEVCIVDSNNKFGEPLIAMDYISNGNELADFCTKLDSLFAVRHTEKLAS